MSAGAASGAPRGAALLDLNVLIALAWPNHVSHADATAWFAAHSAKGWATCPMTEAGFVRISSNPAIIRESVDPRSALEKLREITAHKRHAFWPDDLPLDRLPPEIAASIVGHRQVTDAYLLALAVFHEGKLVTLDGGIRNLVPVHSPHHRSLVVIGA